MRALELLPAIDIKNGKSVRLKQADLDSAEHLKDLCEMVLDGVIVGKTLYVGAIDISVAIKTCHQ